MKYPDFASVLFGKGPLGFFLGYVVIAIICAFISLLIEANNRDVNSANTPIKFSWEFLFAHNLNRIIVNFLLIPIVVRLVYEYVPPQWMLLITVGIGAGADRLTLLFKKLGILTTDKLASKVADKINAS
jgi:hypothetical protein